VPVVTTRIGTVTPDIPVGAAVVDSALSLIFGSPAGAAGHLRLEHVDVEVRELQQQPVERRRVDRRAGERDVRLVFRAVAVRGEEACDVESYRAKVSSIVTSGKAVLFRLDDRQLPADVLRVERLLKVTFSS
jgi:hypothetical protein